MVTPKDPGAESRSDRGGYFSALAKRTRKGGARTFGRSERRPGSSEKEGEVRNSGPVVLTGRAERLRRIRESLRPSARGPHGGDVAGTEGGPSEVSSPQRGRGRRGNRTPPRSRRAQGHGARGAGGGGEAARVRPGGALAGREEILAVPDPGWRSLTSGGARTRSVTPGAGGTRPTSAGVCSRRRSGSVPTAPVLSSTRKPLPEVWFVLDASGSMGPHELGVGVAYATSPATPWAFLRFLTVDVAVHAWVQVSAPSAFVQHLRGGGGTNFWALRGDQPSPGAAARTW